MSWCTQQYKNHLFKKRKPAVVKTVTLFKLHLKTDIAALRRVFVICVLETLIVYLPHAYRMHNKLFCNRCRHKAGPEPPHCNCSIYLCSSHLWRKRKRKETEENNSGITGNQSPFLYRVKSFNLYSNIHCQVKIGYLCKLIEDFPHLIKIHKNTD